MPRHENAGGGGVPGEIVNATMTLLKALLNLFVDDGRLALWIIVLLALVAVVARLGAASWIPMSLLVLGTAGFLLENVIRATRGR